MMTANNAEELSADEIALYDRQLRLWGIEAQNRMRKANILLITMKALGNEVAKNLVLAGIGSLTVLDPDVVTQSDVATQFFVTEEDVGKNRAEASVEEIKRLNPRVQVHHDSSQVKSKSTAFFKDFDIIIATDIPLSTMILLNGYTRVFNIPFYAASLHGLCAIVFVDLIKHTFLVNQTVQNRESGKPEQTTTQKTESYCPIVQSLLTSYGKSLKPRQARKVSPLLPMSVALLSWLDFRNHRNPTPDDLDDFIQLVNDIVSRLALPSTICTPDNIRNFISQLEPSELSSVAAVVGGILGQDVLNALGGRELPLKNWLIFDGKTCEGKIYALMGETNGKASS